MGDGHDSGSAITIRVIEQDGTTFALVCSIGVIAFEVLSEVEMVGSDVILSRLHLDGPGVGTLSPRLLRAAAREFGRQWDAKRVIIEGAIRTTGANPGHKPRRIVIPVE